MNSVFRISKTLLLAIAMTLTVDAAENNKVATASGFAMIDIDGAQFSMSDLQRTDSAGLFQARNALYEAERKAADEFINKYVLDREAKKENVSEDELLKRHAYNNIQEPSEEALHVYFDGIDTTEPYEAVRDKIRDTIRKRRMAKAKAAYVQLLRAHAKVTVRLAPPRAEVNANAPVRGASPAAVKFVEFADYECPYCQQIQPTVRRLEAEYKDRVAFAFKDLPLPMHQDAQKAAEATHCAEAQGKYWEYHDLLFATKQLAVADLKKHARSIGLNGEDFDKCLDSGAEAGRVKASLSEAQAIGLPGTPAFFVNGRFINGAVDYNTLRQVIEEELAANASAVARVRDGGGQ